MRRIAQQDDAPLLVDKLVQGRFQQAKANAQRRLDVLKRLQVALFAPPFAP